MWSDESEDVPVDAWLEFTGYIRATPNRQWKLVDEFPDNYTLALRDGLERGYMGLGNASSSPVQYVLIDARIEPSYPRAIFAQCDLVRFEDGKETILDVQAVVGPPRDVFLWLMANVRTGALGA